MHSLGGEGFQLKVGQAHNRIRQRAQGVIEGLVLRGNVQELGFKLAEEQAAMRSIAYGTVVPSDILGVRAPQHPPPPRLTNGQGTAAKGRGIPAVPTERVTTLKTLPVLTLTLMSCKLTLCFIYILTCY